MSLFCRLPEPLCDATAAYGEAESLARIQGLNVQLSYQLYQARERYVSFPNEANMQSLVDAYRADTSRLHERLKEARHEAWRQDHPVLASVQDTLSDLLCRVNPACPDR